MEQCKIRIPDKSKQFSPKELQSEHVPLNCFCLTSRYFSTLSCLPFQSYFSLQFPLAEGSVISHHLYGYVLLSAPHQFIQGICPPRPSLLSIKCYPFMYSMCLSQILLNVVKRWALYCNHPKKLKLNSTQVCQKKKKNFVS